MHLMNDAFDQLTGQNEPLGLQLTMLELGQ
jgi:hypothetical protein